MIPTANNLLKANDYNTQLTSLRLRQLKADVQVQRVKRNESERASRDPLCANFPFHS